MADMTKRYRQDWIGRYHKTGPKGPRYEAAMTLEELRAYHAKIPPDDRDLNGRLQGDPPSWRSALAERSK